LKPEDAVAIRRRLTIIDFKVIAQVWDKIRSTGELDLKMMRVSAANSSTDLDTRAYLGVYQTSK